LPRYARERIDSKLAQHSDLIHLSPDLGDFAVIESKDYVGVLLDALACRGHSRNRATVNCVHGPAHGNAAAAGNQILNKKVAFRKGGLGFIDNGFIRVKAFLFTGMEKNLLGDESGQQVNSAVSEDVVIETSNDGDVRLFMLCHRVIEK
jgi:hypothetical protein